MGKLGNSKGAPPFAPVRFNHKEYRNPTVHLAVRNPAYANRIGCWSSPTRLLKTACAKVWRNPNRPRRTQRLHLVTCAECRDTFNLCVSTLKIRLSPYLGARRVHRDLMTFALNRTCGVSPAP